MNTENQQLKPENAHKNIPFQPELQQSIDSANSPNSALDQPYSSQAPPVNNQVTPKVEDNPNMFHSILKTSSVMIRCPFCKLDGITVVEEKINYLNVCCCICTSWYCVPAIFWVIYQCVRGKDLNCNDADHYCKHCKLLVYKYSAC